MGACQERLSPELRRPVRWTLLFFGTLGSVGIILFVFVGNFSSDIVINSHPQLKYCIHRVTHSTQSSSMATTTINVRWAGSSFACLCLTSWLVSVQWPIATWWSSERMFAMSIYKRQIYSIHSVLVNHVLTFKLKDGT